MCGCSKKDARGASFCFQTAYVCYTSLYMISSSLSEHLEGRKVAHKILSHKQVFTAYDLAQTMKAKLDEIAKVVLVGAEVPTEKKKGLAYFIVVLPATHHVDLEKLKKALKAQKVEMVAEKAMKKLGFVPGAFSPFGSKYGYKVILDKTLTKSKKIIAGAENFTDSVVVSVKDFVKAEQPLLASFGKKNTLKIQKVVKQAKKVVKKVKKDAKKVVAKTKKNAKKAVGKVKMAAKKLKKK